MSGENVDDESREHKVRLPKIRRSRRSLEIPGITARSKTENCSKALLKSRTLCALDDEETFAASSFKDGFGIDDDESFEFMEHLPVVERMFKDRLRLHVGSASKCCENVVCQGTTYRPVASITTEVGDDDDFEVACLFAVPISGRPYLALFQKLRMMSETEAVLLWIVVSTFGLFTRKKVIVQWHPSAALSREQWGLRSCFGRELLKDVMAGFDCFVATIENRFLVTDVLRRMLKSRHVRFVRGGDEFGAYLRESEGAFLIRSTEHDPTRSPYYTEQLREFCRRHTADTTKMYDYLMLERLWGDNSRQRAVLAALLQPASRRHWPRAGFLQ